MCEWNGPSLSALIQVDKRDKFPSLLKFLLKVTPYDENIDFVLFYIFIDLYRVASDLSISANIF
jgi:hypothetical protein